MATIDPSTLTPDQLAPMLRAWATGSHPTEAAVELLIAHRRWLTRRDFLTTLVDAIDDAWGDRGDIVAMAAIRWDGVATFLDDPGTATSSDELTILRLAAALAGTRIEPSVADPTGDLAPADPAQQLPTFEDMRAQAHRLLGDAADWLRSDWRPSTGPGAPAADAVRDAFDAIERAKSALNRAAHAETIAAARHRRTSTPRRRTHHG